MRTSLVGLLVAAVTVLVVAPAASAKMAPCLGGTAGAKCHVWNAKVGPVDDGDTLNAKINGTKKWLKVRLNGVQAMELHSYKHNHRSGECMSVKATLRLAQLVKATHKHIRLYAMNKNSRAEGERTRYRRSVGVKVGGRWTDAGTVLMREGLALWIPSAVEWAWNRPYSQLAQQAQAAHKNLWNPTACGGAAKHSQLANDLNMKLKWDAEDNDAHNANGEWVRVTNFDPVNALSLKGWWLRDSYLRTDLHGPNKGRGFLFPANASIPPLGSIRIHAGKGSNSATDLYWGLGEAPFENATNDKKAIGDGAYLFDPRGNIRAAVQYPCRLANCRDPLAGKLQVSARYKGGVHPATHQINEWAYIKNVSSAPVTLAQYELESVPWFYEFGRADVIQPGKSIVVFMSTMPKRVPARDGVPAPLWTPVSAGLLPFGDTQPGGFRAWNNTHAPLLADNKDVITIRNPAGAPVACASWGGLRCPSI
jgi:micrococcal nuclease